jgi:hypothetical protein
LNGSTSIPNNKLILLADRLNFSIAEIHFLFNIQYNKQYNKILEVFKLIKNSSYQEAYALALKINKEVIVSSTNKTFLDYCLIKCQYELELASKIQVLEKFSNLIGYPECISKMSFNRIELAILIEIVHIAASMENYEPADLLYKVLVSDNFEYISSDDRSFVPSLYYSLARALNSQKKYKEIIELTNKAIQYCLSYETSNAIAHLFLVNSLAHYDLGHVSIAHNSAKKAIMYLYIQNNETNYYEFKNVIEKKFGISVSELMKTDW